MQKYHMRRPEKEIKDQNILNDIILNQKYMTLAMCKDNSPYLATVNYYYDPDYQFFYLHCSPTGKKIDYLKANPAVWGQVMEDLGYIQGKCDHGYKTVQFKGRAEFIIDTELKIEALTHMMQQLEENPSKERLNSIKEKNLEEVAILKIHIEDISGKENI